MPAYGVRRVPNRTAADSRGKVDSAGLRTGAATPLGEPGGALTARHGPWTGPVDIAMPRESLGVWPDSRQSQQSTMALCTERGCSGQIIYTSFLEIYTFRAFRPFDPLVIPIHSRESMRALRQASVKRSDNSSRRIACTACGAGVDT